MKDRKFWENHIAKALSVIKTLDSLIECKNLEIKTRISLLAPYRSKVKEDKLNSSLGHLCRRRAYWVARIGFYQGRILALKNRTRYQRILRSPVI